MIVIDATNVNDAWHRAKSILNQHGVLRSSRAGDVLEVPEPVTTRYVQPRERVLFDAVRDCNPFFHFMEGLWMLSGRNDVAWISQFNQRMMSFSDDGQTYHAAYGHRWRRHFEVDQLPVIAKMLKENHAERRAVLQMWNPSSDLGAGGKDLPCNTNVYFKVRDGALLMTVCNRSNDIVWGCYGANCVHMSMLQEYMAAMIGVEVGPYHQISDSWHAYTEYWEKYGGTSRLPLDDRYYLGSVRFRPLVDDAETFDKELLYWMESSNRSEPHTEMGYNNSVFPDVALPMLLAWREYKQKEYVKAMNFLDYVRADDWRVACHEWITRRVSKKVS